VAIKRIFSGNAESKVAYEIEFADTKSIPATVEKTSLTTLNTDQKITASFAAKATEETPVFFHKNRNGTIAIATGAAPKVWPEDEMAIK